MVRATAIGGLGGTIIALLSGAGAAGCGENQTPADVPDPRICTTTWRTVYSPVDQTFPAPFGKEHTMASHGGQIYLNASRGLVEEQEGLWAIPTVGGPATRVYAGPLWSLWIEDDDLIFGEGSTLYRLPISGGDPQPILTHHIYDPGLSSRFVAAWALDREALYWILYDYASLTVWRSLRDGSGDQQIGTLPGNDTDPVSSHRLVLIGDQIFVTADTKVWVLAKGGGEVTAVPSTVAINGHVIAMAADGAMLWWRGVGDMNHYRQELVRATLDMSPGNAVWSFEPRTTAIDGAWSDGAGGWYIAAEEKATDAGIHTTIHSLAQGEPKPTRLACDPQIDRVAFSGEGTSDGVFVLVGDVNTWEIAAVARQP